MAILKRFQSLPALLIVFLIAETTLAWIGSNGIGTPMGDLTFAYQPWSEQVLSQHLLLGIAVPWVYPFPALLPILISALASPQNFTLGWLALHSLTTTLMLVGLIGFGTSRRESPSKSIRYLAAYAFVGFTLALGPVAISRIDSFSVLVAVFACLLIAIDASRMAAIALTLAAWIKIWPIAIFAPLMFLKDRVRLVAAGAGASIALILVGWMLGGNASVFSFATGQFQRGIQIEAPAAMPWIWLGALGASDSGIRYNQSLLTFEVFGSGTDLVATLLSLVQLGAILITFGLGWLASKKNSKKEVFAWTALTGVCDLIFFNKVGSPQFISWLAVPIILGVLLQAERWSTASVLVLALSFSTWILYPMVYDDLLSGGLLGTVVLTVRNVLELVLLVYANVRLSALANKKS